MSYVRPECEVCDKPLMPLLSPARPESSEFYCMKDHKSYEMTKEARAVEFQLRGNSVKQ